MRGEFTEARDSLKRAERTYLELGLRLAFAGLTQVAGPVELLAGDPSAAAAVLRRGYEVLHEIGVTGDSDALLAEALYQEGDYMEAASVAAEAAVQTSESDVAPRALLLGVQAKLAARAGQGGEREAETGVELASATDALNLHGDALASLAETLRLLGREDEGSAAAERAARLYERKGNIAALARLEGMTV
jgi:ATP/maltotriose-dependent transcriptional regulator MalT